MGGMKMRGGSANRPKEGIFNLLISDIFFLAGVFRKRGARMSKKVGLTHPQWALLVAATSGTRTVPQIARRLGLSRQNVQRNADQLVKRGLGVYSKNPDHQRSPFFLPTADGEATLNRLEQVAQHSRIEFMASHQVANEDLQVAQRVLRELRNYVDPQNSEVPG